MAVTQDAISTSQTDTAVSQTSANHTNLTIGSSLSNGALVFIAIFDLLTVSGLTLTWDNGGTNQAMTNLGTVSSTGAHGICFLFGLRNPTSGNKTLRAAWTGAAQCSLFGISFAGVDQTNDATAFQHFNSASATSTSPAVTITSATGNRTVAGFVDTTQSFTATGPTQLYLDSTMSLINCAGSTGAGAATVNMTGTIGAVPDTWAALGIDVAAASGDVLMSQIFM